MKFYSVTIQMNPLWQYFKKFCSILTLVNFVSERGNHNLLELPYSPDSAFLLTFRLFNLSLKHLGYAKLVQTLE